MGNFIDNMPIVKITKGILGIGSGSNCPPTPVREFLKRIKIQLSCCLDQELQEEIWVKNLQEIILIITIIKIL